MIYSLERLVCDAIKYDNPIGQDMVKEVVEAYLQRRDKDIELLLRTAKEVNIYNKVHQVFSLLI